MSMQMIRNKDNAFLCSAIRNQLKADMEAIMLNEIKPRIKQYVDEAVDNIEINASHFINPQEFGETLRVIVKDIREK